ncbi:hypothetical protein SDC9_81259 [bioreactor metagenome]|uniref:Uncharacterized protein n=1 Tax=bioreactor metagenome TaxID=1076179 RepID=A0A644Z1S0_9ZZZZ
MPRLEAQVYVVVACALQTLENFHHHLAQRVQAAHVFQPPAHVAQRVVGAGNETGNAVEQPHAVRPEFVQRRLLVGSLPVHAEDETLGLAQLDGVGQQRAVHGDGAQHRVGVLVDEGVAGRDQPAQIQVLAKKVALGHPHALEALVIGGDVGLAADQHDQHGVLVQQLGLADELAPHLGQMLVQIHRRAMRVVRLFIAQDDAGAQRREILRVELLHVRIRAEATAVAREGEPLFKS